MQHELPAGVQNSVEITKAKFRIILAFSVVTTIAAAVTSYASFPSLPPELREYVRAGAGASLPRGALLALSVVGAALAVVTVVGLFLFWRPARALLLAQFVLGLAVSPALLGATVESAWASSLYALSDVLGGAIMTLVFFSPIARLFDRRNGNK